MVTKAIDDGPSTTHGPTGETGQRILDVALTLFTEHGFAASSIRDIAQALRLTKASLYYHFRSKDEILERLTFPVVAELEQVLAGVGQDAPLPQQQAALLDGLLEACLRHRAVIQLFFGDVGLRSHSTVGPKVGAVAGRFLSRLAGPDSDPDGIVRAHQAMACIRVALDLPDAAAVRDRVLFGACQVLGIPTA